MDVTAFSSRAIDELGDDDIRIFRAPGRVNLIGEHTDYNDGFVLPAAIERDILVATHPTGGRQVSLRSMNYEAVSSFSLDEIGYDAANPWSNYLRGVCFVLEEAGYHLRGADLFFGGDVPIGSGLSSSAALEVATATAFLALAEYEVSGQDIALLAQRAENHFVGAHCGIMDQFISALGIRGHALLIDCRSLESRAVPIPAGVKMIIGDTGVRRGLVASEYNTRRAQCEEGVTLLRSALPAISALRDVTPDQLEEYRQLLPAEVYRRCRHVVTENARVSQAIKAMERDDLESLGCLLDASHESLRDDFMVSCPELDAMVKLAQQQPGVLGARMTGAGFGGCTISLVREEHVASFVTEVAPAYQQMTGREPQIYISSATDGAGEIRC